MASAAVVLRLRNGHVNGARIALGASDNQAVAMTEAEAALTGKNRDAGKNLRAAATPRCALPSLRAKKSLRWKMAKNGLCTRVEHW